ncbi:relaxase/mobilization nuclease domain-containing protein [uncultured Lacinutrix sp.]|uniref:relaxase/mobilization nuclease domain-containing protein n=1 Tax=uncultured Lacinutrix sp. TaxID=574032 RepID=UPI0026126D23|nr:relaxase/mobilization nuclease domain-containing protein [uncultured Lacinutrix sp.]
MIIKSKSYKHNKSFKTVVDYVLREAEQDDSFVLTRFIKGKNLSNNEISKQFYANEQHRINPRKNNVKLYMEILSFHSDDAKDLTNDKLKKIAREYLKLRSPLSVALVTAHKKEKDHVHLHILLSGVEYKTGKSIRISRDDFKNKVKLPMEQFQEKHFPELSKSAINHNPSKKKF